MASPSGGVYSRKHIIEVPFAEGVANGEDSYFTYLLLATKPRVIFRDIKLNKIAIREGSATHSPTLERVKRFSKNVQYLSSLHDQQPQGNSYRRIAIDRSMYGAIMSATNMYLRSGGRNWKEIYDILEIKKLWRLSSRWLPLHQKIKIFLINFNYWLYYMMVKTGYN